MWGGVQWVVDGAVERGLQQPHLQDGTVRRLACTALRGGVGGSAVGGVGCSRRGLQWVGLRAVGLDGVGWGRGYRGGWWTSNMIQLQDVAYRMCIVACPVC
jgi:hypothetical protein